MINYYFEDKDNVSDFTFLNKIKLVKEELINKFNLNTDAIILIRDRQAISYQVQNIKFTGRLIEFEIKNNNNVVTFLNCFKSDFNDCMEISTFDKL